MEYASIERELYVEAAPEIVYEVVSSPEHFTEWWPEEADFVGAAGESGTITFHHEGQVVVVPLTVVVADPPRTFSFRWTQDAGAEAVTGNSLLVSFELVPSGSGTLVKLTETGFREMGWEAAVLEATYADHVVGWDHHFPRLGEYIARLVGAS
jgi:uncharacterized protein YndB with AHSA1/START domain